MAKRYLEKVPGRECYSQKYVDGKRAFSYAHQLAASLSFAPDSVIEIGVGGGFVANMLRAAGIDVTTVDVQSELRPNVLASVDALPFESKCCDVVLCCQVLEHLPYARFVQSVKELLRIARMGAVVSLPDVTKYHYVQLRLPKTGHRTLSVSFPAKAWQEMPPKKYENSGHHWEIGFKGYALGRISKELRKEGIDIQKTWRVTELPWHRFFVFRSSV